MRKATVVYFAHLIPDYNTARARKAKESIVSFRPNARIADPAESAHTFYERLQEGNPDFRLSPDEAHDAVYRRTIASVDEVVVLEKQGFVGRGVFREVEIALLERKLPCWVLRRRQFLPIKIALVCDTSNYARRYGRIVVDGGEDEQ